MAGSKPILAHVAPQQVLSTHYRFKNLTGRVFCRLTVLEYSGKVNGRTHWLCRCDCGNTSIIETVCLSSGNTSSCGCLKKDILLARNVKHGGTGSKEYRAWQKMRERCSNPHAAHYECYGGRGIMVCDRWQSFENFLADMGPKPSPKHSIDRIDNNGNYEAGNCRWATNYEQSTNTRRTILVEVDGQKVCLKEAARRNGLNYGTVRDRIANGWSIVDALTNPVLRSRS